jgi:hypothetical protein
VGVPSFTNLQHIRFLPDIPIIVIDNVFFKRISDGPGHPENNTLNTHATSHKFDQAIQTSSRFAWEAANPSTWHFTST